MLTAAYIDSLPVELSALYSGVEEEIVADIARRLAKTNFTGFDSTAAWEVYKAEEMSITREQLVSELAKQTGKTNAEIKRLFIKANIKSAEFDAKIMGETNLKSETQINLLNAGIRKCQGAVTNITRTAVNDTTGIYGQVLDTAYIKAQSGAFPLDRVIKDAIKTMASNGISYGVYTSNGKKLVQNIDGIIRRAVVTGVNQTNAQLQMDRMDQTGWDLVLVTSHSGSRPEHAAWQGKVYSRSGKSDKYPDLVTSTGYGSVTGLCGANCRHNFYPFLEGVSENTFDQYVTPRKAGETAQEANDRMYAEVQEQRRIERNIRKWKREVTAIEAAGQDASEEIIKVQEWQGKMRTHIRQTGLTRRSNREGGAYRAEKKAG